MFAFRGQREINLKILFKNTFKIATFLPLENFFTNGFIIKVLNFFQDFLNTLQVFLLNLLPCQLKI